jgi:hypothetical protein
MSGPIKIQFYKAISPTDRWLKSKTGAAIEFSDKFCLHLSIHHYIRIILSAE